MLSDNFFFSAYSIHIHTYMYDVCMAETQNADCIRSDNPFLGAFSSQICVCVRFFMHVCMEGDNSFLGAFS